jgi:hypothetical protein
MMSLEFGMPHDTTTLAHLLHSIKPVLPYWAKAYSLVRPYAHMDDLLLDL